MKVTALYTPSNSILQRSLALHEQHNEIYNHDMHILRTPIVRGFANKLYHLQSLITVELQKPIEERAEWILSFTPTLLLTSPHHNLSTFLPPSFNSLSPTSPNSSFQPYTYSPTSFHTLTFIGTKPNHYSLSSDIFLIRVSSLALRLLSMAIVAGYTEPEVLMKSADEGGDGGRGRKDEEEEDMTGAALQFILEKEEWRDKVVYQPRGWWIQDTHELKSSDTAVFGHVGGGSEVLRLVGMKKLLEGIERSTAGGGREDMVTGDMERKQHDVSEYWRILSEARIVLERAREIPGSGETEGDFMQRPSVIKELKDWAELFSFDIQGVKDRTARVKQEFKIGEIVGYDSVV